MYYVLLMKVQINILFISSFMNIDQKKKKKKKKKK